MSVIKIVLKKDVQNLGEEGEIKTVKRGYARNFLFPNGLADTCNSANLNELKTKKDYLDKRTKEKVQTAENLKTELEKVKLIVKVAAGDKGRLFGTVTSLNLSDELKKLKFNIDRKNIELKDHIKFKGKYKFRVHLYQNIYANLELEVDAITEKPKENVNPRNRRSKRTEYIENNNENSNSEENEIQSESNLESENELNNTDKNS